MKTNKDNIKKGSVPTDIPKPSNTWLSEFDIKKSTSIRLNKTEVTDESELKRKPCHEKYEGGGKGRR